MEHQANSAQVDLTDHIFIPQFRKLLIDFAIDDNIYILFNPHLVDSYKGHSKFLVVLL